MYTEKTGDVIPRLRTTWLDSNRLRAYPLDESTTNGGIPTQLFVDALFLNSYNIDSERLYIRTLVKDGDNINIYMAGYVDGAATDFGLVAVVPFSTTFGTKVPIEKETGTYLLAGTLVVGSTEYMNEAPSAIELTEDTGKLFPGCVRQTHDTLVGIKLNGTIYSGVVTIEAGDGVSITAHAGQEIGETIITIAADTSRRVPAENTQITSDEDILRHAIAEYGEPVRTICGISPDSTGNIMLASPTETSSGEYITQTSATQGVISLAIANDKTDTRCTDNSSKFESISKNLATLNQRSGEIDELITALEETVSNLSLQVSRG
jgi:hypothetical protein